MNGLIGNADSAKFIFIAVDDENEIPTKTVMSNFFPKHQMNVYKAWGHFSHSFVHIESYFKIKFNGISIYDAWGGRSPRCISHAIRLSNTCPLNSFFALKYAYMVIGYYHLSQDLMRELEDLLTLISKVNSISSTIENSRDNLIKGIEVSEQNNLPDFKMRQPSTKSISDLFDNYGEAAKQELMKRLIDWNTRAVWL